MSDLANAVARYFPNGVNAHLDYVAAGLMRDWAALSESAVDLDRVLREMREPLRVLYRLAKRKPRGQRIHERRRKAEARRRA